MRFPQQSEDDATQTENLKDKGLLHYSLQGRLFEQISYTAILEVIWRAMAEPYLWYIAVEQSLFAFNLRISWNNVSPRYPDKKKLRSTP